jgi:hypothetical protein
LGWKIQGTWLEYSTPDASPTPAAWKENGEWLAYISEIWVVKRSYKVSVYISEIWGVKTSAHGFSLLHYLGVETKWT